MRKNFVWGLLFIVIGVIFLGNNFEIWDIDILFDGWWTLFIIVPCTLNLKKDLWSSLFGVIFGLLLLATCQDLITWSMMFKTIVPIIIIIVGLSIMFRPNLKNKISISKKGKTEYTGIFSGVDERVQGKFQSSTCTSIFGGIDLDLRDAKIKEDIVIECTSIFAGIDIKVPNDVNIETNGTAILGGFENKVLKPKNEKFPTIYINYICIFGGIDII